MFSQSFVLFTYYLFFLVYPVKLQQLYEVLVVLKSWVLFLLFSQASKTVQIASYGGGGVFVCLHNRCLDSFRL